MNRVAPALLVGATICCMACTQSNAPLRVVDVSSGLQATLQIDPSVEVDFSGRYISPQTGTVDIVQTGLVLSGAYVGSEDDCAFAGRVLGRVTGNVARLAWTETRTCRAGWTATVTGQGELVLDLAQPGDGVVRLFGHRASQRARPPTPDRTYQFVPLQAPTPWSAQSLVRRVPLATRGSGQARPLSNVSDAQMSIRFDVSSRALSAAVEQCCQPGDALLRLIHDAEIEQDQMRSALRAWRNGDQRRFLQIEYCFGQSLSRLALALGQSGRPVPPGLSGVVPDAPPTTWDSYPCATRQPARTE